MKDPLAALLISNDVRLARRLARSLGPLGVSVEPCADRKWHELSDSHLRSVQLALLDWRTLEEDGYAFLNRLRAKQPQIYAVVVCGKSALPKVGEYLRGGFDGYLPSDATEAALQALVHQCRAAIDMRESAVKLTAEKKTGEQFFKSLLNATHEAIVLLNQDFDIQYCNDTCQKFLNENGQQLINRNFQQFVVDGFKVLHYVYQQLAGGNKIQGYRVRLKPSHNEAFDVNLKAEFLYSLQGYVEGIILTLENQTMQDEIVTQLIRSERLNTLQMLAQVLAHEIHNPINILSGRFQLLHKDLSDKKYQKSFEIIYRQVGRIAEIIDQLQKFNRNKEDSVPETFPLIEFLEEFIAERRQSSSHQYSLEFQKNEKELLIRANRVQFEDAFDYLFRVLEGLLPQDTKLNLHCRLIRSFTQQPSLEVQLDLSGTGVTEDMFQPGRASLHHEKYSILDLALVHIIFSNYGGKVLVDSLFGDKKFLRLQFAVAGVKNMNGNSSRRTSGKKVS